MKPKYCLVEYGNSFPSESYELVLPKSVVSKMSLEADHKPYRLHFGKYQTTIKLKISNEVKPDNVIRCSSAMSPFKGIPAGTKLTLKHTEGGLFLGPIIGLFTVKFDTTPGNPFGKQAKHLLAIYKRAEKANCLVYVFGPEDICPQDNTVYGYLPDPSYKAEQFSGQYPSGDDGDSEPPPRWERLSFPLPNAIYNRVPSRRWENTDGVTNALSLLRDHYGIPIYNPGFLDKLTVQQKLSAEPELVNYLPQTSLFTDHKLLLEYLHRFKAVYLKPTSGSLGKKILKISLASSVFKYKFHTPDGESVEEECSSLDQLKPYLKKFMGDKIYIIQQAIPLALYKGQEFDVRLLVQKDKYGQWRRTKTYVRISQPGSITANISTGATAMSIVKVIREVFGQDFFQRGGIGDNIKRTALQIANAVENHVPGSWAELGIDFGIDYRGKIWLIEVNAKPFRALPTASGTNQRIERSFLRPLEYGRFLTGFYPHSI